MLNIVPYSTDENLPIIKHGEHVFHDALALVQKGETRFRVIREDGEDYDLQYTDNMDLFPEQVKFLTPCGKPSQRIFWLFPSRDSALPNLPRQAPS